MPFPVIAAIASAVIGRATKKAKKRQAVSKYTTQKGKKVKAYTRKSR